MQKLREKYNFFHYWINDDRDMLISIMQILAFPRFH